MPSLGDVHDALANLLVALLIKAYLDQDGTIITCVHLQRPREASEAGSAERCTPGQERVGAEAVALSKCGEAMIEACVLYESWMLLQQALSQVIARQPVILLATAHVLQEDMHPDLLSFFSPRNVILLDQDLPIAEPKKAHLPPTSTSSGALAASQGKQQTEPAQEAPAKSGQANERRVSVQQPPTMRARSELNIAEAEQQRALQQKVQESIAWCGAQLSADERLRALCRGTRSDARSSQSS